MPLLVKCKECGATFTSKIQMADTSSWHKPLLIEGIKQDCPDCRKNFSYTKADHFFQ